MPVIPFIIFASYTYTSKYILLQDLIKRADSIHGSPVNSRVEDGLHSLELQAPQGPYTNVLDLQVFPAMSKKHSELLQIYSNTQADNERIWKIALGIWKGMTSAMIARAFILAYRIMKRIMETKGETEWLKNGTPHCQFMCAEIFLILTKVS